MGAPIGAVHMAMSAGAAQFEKDMGRARRAVGKNAKGMSKSMSRAKRSFDSTLQSIKLMAAGAIGIAALNKLVVKSYQAFKDFETAVVDMGKVTSRSIGDLKDDIAGIEPILGTATELMKGYYQVISAGITDPRKALKLLTVAAKASKAAHLDQAETIKALTKVMAGFEGQVKTAADAADLLFAIEKSGQTSFAELVPIVGSLSTLTSTLGGTTDDLAASLSILTQVTGSTAEAATQYEGLLIALYKPTVDLQKLFESWGFTTGQLAVKELGFIETIKKLKKHVADTGGTLGKFIGRKEALLAVTALSTDNFKKFNSVLEVVRDRAGSASRAFSDWEDTTEAAISSLSGEFNRLQIQIGETFGDDSKVLINDFATALGGVSKVMKAMNESDSLAKDFWLTWLGIKHLKFYYNLIKEILREIPILWITAQSNIVMGFLHIENAAKKALAVFTNFTSESRIAAIKQLEAELKNNIKVHKEWIDSLIETQNKLNETFDIDIKTTPEETKIQEKKQKSNLKDGTATTAGAKSDVIAGEKEYQALLREGIAITQALRTEAEIYADEMNRLWLLQKDGIITQETYQRGMEKAKDTFKNAGKDLDEYGDRFEELTMAIEGWSSDSADAILEFTKGGKDAFKNMADSIIDDMLRMMFQKTITDKLFGFLGGFFSGGGGAPPGGATGRSVSSNGLYEIDERRPEIFNLGGRQFLSTASMNGRVIPNTDSVGGSLTISVPVTVANRNPAMQAELRRDIEQTVENVLRRHS